jgi:glycerophosphoryl diester phosphodiesterase
VNNLNWEYNDFLISSFNHYELREFIKLNPHIKIGTLITGIPIGYAEFAEKVNAFSVHPSIEFINQDFVDDTHNRGMQVYVWTVNDWDDIKRMKDLGVDGMISNYPDRIKKINKY